MPIVRIDIQSGKSTAYKRAILHGVREAITDALGVGNERVMQRIAETEPEDIDVPEIRTERLTIVEIAMIAGRDEHMKAELYRQIVRHLGRDPGIAEHDIVVVVSDPPAECFCVGGAVPGTLPDPGTGPATEPGADPAHATDRTEKDER